MCSRLTEQELEELVRCGPTTILKMENLATKLSEQLSKGVATKLFFDEVAEELYLLRERIKKVSSRVFKYKAIIIDESILTARSNRE